MYRISLRGEAEKYTQYASPLFKEASYVKLMFIRSLLLLLLLLLLRQLIGILPTRSSLSLHVEGC